MFHWSEKHLFFSWVSYRIQIISLKVPSVFQKSPPKARGFVEKFHPREIQVQYED